MKMTYGMNSVLLWSIFNALGAQSRTHILPENQIQDNKQIEIKQKHSLK